MSIDDFTGVSRGDSLRPSRSEIFDSFRRKYEEQAAVAHYRAAAAALGWPEVDRALPLEPSSYRSTSTVDATPELGRRWERRMAALTSFAVASLVAMLTLGWSDLSWFRRGVLLVGIAAFSTTLVRALVAMRRTRLEVSPAFVRVGGRTSIDRSTIRFATVESTRTVGRPSFRHGWRVVLVLEDNERVAVTGWCDEDEAWRACERLESTLGLLPDEGPRVRIDTSVEEADEVDEVARTTSAADRRARES